MVRDLSLTGGTALKGERDKVRGEVSGKGSEAAWYLPSSSLPVTHTGRPILLLCF